MNNYMHPLVNKGAKNDMKVSAENALKGYVSFPNYEEQKAIAEAFSIIDCLITLHQCKRIIMLCFLFISYTMQVLQIRCVYPNLKLKLSIKIICKFFSKHINKT